MPGFIPNILVLGASGRIGSRLVKELDEMGDRVAVRLASSSTKSVEKWKSEGRDAVRLDLNEPATLAPALEGADRVFLLTPYTADMLVQSKHVVDAAKDAGVTHIVHLGVFTSRRDPIPHFIWHDFIETYIEASGIAWTHLHPNVIAEGYLVQDPPITVTGSFNVMCGDAVQGWIFADDIAAVAAKVLAEGPDVHASQEYWMSTELLTGPQAAEIITQESGISVTCNAMPPEALAHYVASIEDTSTRAYMESAVITMKCMASGDFKPQTVVRDDVSRVLGRPATTVAEWARRNFA